MASVNRDISSYALALGTREIPLGGEDVAAEISYEEEAAVTYGVSTSIKTRTPNSGATIAISCYAEDAAHRELLQLHQQRRRPGGQEEPLNGLAIGPGETVSWQDCVISQRPNTTLGVASPILTWTIQLIGWQISPTAE